LCHDEARGRAGQGRSRLGGLAPAHPAAVLSNPRS
jgi:hypothetical protein